MSKDEIIKNLNDLLEHNYLEDVCYLREENDYIIYNNAIQGLLDLYNKTKEDKSRYYYEWKHLEANIINKINELEEINMDVFTFEIAEDLKRLLEEN